MASKQLRQIEENVSKAIDMPEMGRAERGDNLGYVGGPTSETMYGPGDGVRDPNRENYIAAQQNMNRLGTDQSIQDYENARGRMGVRMNTEDVEGGNDTRAARAINQAWIRYNQDPTDGNAQLVQDMLRQYHAGGRTDESGNENDP